jgi:hypothetical protein
MPMKKKIAILSLLIFLCAGCAKKVAYNISEEFIRSRPNSVVVMPVVMRVAPGEGEREVLKLVRSTVSEKLKEKYYSSVSIDEVNRELAQRGLLKGEKLPAPQLVAPVFKSDAVLYTHITKWNEDKVASYAALKIGAEFLLYSPNGDLLWKGSYTTKESDFRLDSAETTELGVLKAYEPRVQRIVDAVFMTLPPAVRKTKKQNFYKWLP